MNYPHQQGIPAPAGPQQPSKQPMSTGRRVALIVGLSVLGIAVFALLGVLLSRAAAKQSGDCDTLYAEASRLVAAGDPGARASIERARARCMSGLKVPELAALETKAAHNEEAAKTLAAKPALLAAGIKEEQLQRSTMAAACKARGLMVVEMTNYRLAGEPHYWDCDKSIPYQEGRQSPEACEAKHMEFSTMQGEDGEPVGVCKTKAAEVPAGLMRIKKEGVYVGAVTEPLLEKAVEIAASGDRAAFTKFMKGTPGVALMQPRLEVFIVDTSGFLASRVKVRKKGGTQEVWVLSEALESIPSE